MIGGANVLRTELLIVPPWQWESDLASLRPPDFPSSLCLGNEDWWLCWSPDSSCFCSQTVPSSNENSSFYTVITLSQTFLAAMSNVNVLFRAFYTKVSFAHWFASDCDKPFLVINYLTLYRTAANLKYGVNSSTQSHQLEMLHFIWHKTVTQNVSSDPGESLQHCRTTYCGDGEYGMTEV